MRHRLVQKSPAGVFKAAFGSQIHAEQAWTMLKAEKIRHPRVSLRELWTCTDRAVTDWCIIETDEPEFNDWGEISL